MEALQGNYGFVGVQEFRTRTFFKVILANTNKRKDPDK